MNTIYDLGMAIEQIRTAASSMEVRGMKNVEALYTIFQLCNDVINTLNEVVSRNTVDNSINQDGDGDGQVDS